MNPIRVYLNAIGGVTKHSEGSPTKTVHIAPQKVLQEHLCFNSVYLKILSFNLYNLTTWSNSWNLLLNTSKCFHLHYHFSNARYPTNSYAIIGNTMTTKNHMDLEIMLSTILH